MEEVSKEPITATRPTKELTNYPVLDKMATKAEVKANKTDAGGNFYIYDLFDDAGTCIALNRYVFKNSPKQPFEELTAAEELVLNPAVVELEPEV